MITKIKLTNFQSHKDTELELHPGLNVIYGESDQGKTAILRALTWVMTNRPLSNRFLMRGAKECRVEITTDKGTVVRERRRGFNGYIVNGETFKEIGSSVPPQVAEVLNLGEINLQPQLSPFFLITQSPGQIARYISELLGYDVIDLAQSECKSRLTAATSLVNETSASMQGVNEQLDKLSAVDELQELLAQADEADERRAGLVEQRARLEFNLNEVAEQRVAIESYRRTLDGVEQVNDQLTAFVDDAEALVREHHRLGEILVNTLGPKVVIQKYAGLREVAQLIDKLEAVCDVATALNAEFLSLERGVAAVNGAAKSVQVRAETAAAYEDELTKAREQYAEQLFEQGYCPYCNTELDHTMATYISEAI
jgi:DNA repair exonuclease SbcCD ATPase subunit